MGSTGSGRFSDYSNTPKTDSGGGSSGGASGSDRCGQAFTASLEDVASYDYHKNHGSGPTVGTPLTIEVRGRVVAMAGSEIVGALPTKFNYLAACIQGGFSYTGVVTVSTNASNPQVHADFLAI